MIRPPYSATDYGLAVAAVLTGSLNLLAMFGVAPLDAVTRGVAVNALSGILGVVIAALVANRGLKHIARGLAGQPRP